MRFVAARCRREERGRAVRAMCTHVAVGSSKRYGTSGSICHISGVFESLAVILGVLSVSKHARIEWYRWFCAPCPSQKHRTVFYLSERALFCASPPARHVSAFDAFFSPLHAGNRHNKSLTARPSPAYRRGVGGGTRPFGSVCRVREDLDT